MNKNERKELLEKMVAANDKISAEREYAIFEYASLLMQFVSNADFHNAKAIEEYVSAEYKLEDLQEELVHCENGFRAHDLKILIEDNIEKIEHLYKAMQEAKNYFLGIEPELYDMPV